MIKGKDRPLKNTKEVSNFIKNYLGEVMLTSCAEVPSMNIDTLKETMRNTLDLIKNKKGINTFSNLNADFYQKYVYKVTSCSQLNSIHFITEKDDIKTNYIKMDTLDIVKAKEKAFGVVSPGATILKVVFDHSEEDTSRVDISFRYTPKLSVNTPYLVTKVSL